MIHGLTVQLQLKDVPVNFVDHQHGPDFLLAGLSEHCFSLDTDSLHTVDNDECTVSDSECGSDFRGEVDVARGVDKVNEVRALGALIIEVVLIVQRHSCGLDSDTSFLLIFPGVCVPSLACLF